MENLPVYSGLKGVWFIEFIEANLKHAISLNCLANKNAYNQVIFIITSDPILYLLKGIFNIFRIRNFIKPNDVFLINLELRQAHR